MKVTLDLSQLLADGDITATEAERLKVLSKKGTGALGINILLGFGVVAVSLGAIALLPNPLTVLIVGALLFGGGLALILSRSRNWEVVAQICLVVGALLFTGAVLTLGEGSLASCLIVTAALAAAAVVAGSSLLAAGAVIALASCLGAQSGYMHASYSLAIYEPLLTVILFSVLAFVLYRASFHVTHIYERVALNAARTAVLVVNFGFWIGSLWGDRLTLLRKLARTPGAPPPDDAYVAVIPYWSFGVAWALALLAVGIWGARADRRWVVNVAAVFGAIHFYTQWFERLGATPISLFLAGLLMLAFALALWFFNKRPAQ